MLNRREIVTAALVASLLPVLSPAAATPRMRRIPASGELLPVIGLGTSRTFDVGADSAARDALLPAFQEFFSLGGRVIDSSPMYGSAESVTGYLLSRIKIPGKPFVATKVWTTGKEAGETQMRASIEQLGTGQIDLMQVHNLEDWRTQLATLRDWKAAGKIRYIGITTSRTGQYADFEAVMRTESLDFVQLNYSAGEREAEQTLLPLALERNMAVLVNRPYMRGELFKRVRGKPLPGWAADYRCDSWGQLFLNFALSNPAVTCLIPATSSLRHMTDNMGAGFAREPDATFRQRLLAEIA